MTYYLKYRPQKIQELDNQNVRVSLDKIVKSGSIPHAFLFAGPRGTGKTSAARIMAKVVNCTKNKKKSKEPCNKCNICKSIQAGTNIDVIEIDAASHRGIDDVRAIKEAVKLVPAEAKYKVFIIDEAHMLTTEASNALLKTLEEPPSHVMLILATTNPEKLISTIRSRTVIINFKKATTDEIVGSLEKITKGEKLPYKKDVLELIAKSSDGSFRDATKILEQIVTENVKPDRKKVEEFIRTSTPTASKEILEVVISGKLGDALKMIEKAADMGVFAEEMLDNMLEVLHDEMLAKEGVGDLEVIYDDLSQENLVLLVEYLLEAKGQISDATIEHMPVEMAFIKWVKENDDDFDEEDEDEKKKDVKESEVKENKKLRVNINTKAKNLNDELWLKILDQMRNVNYTIEALLRASKPMDFDGKTLRLGVFYKFHKERLEEIRNMTVLEEVVAKVMAKPTRVECVLTQPEKVVINKETVVNVEEPKDSLEDDDIIKVAKDIFGG